MSADTSILPSELLATPLPLIGFAGLDVAKNSVHKMIWESFSTNKKNDRALIQYKLLPLNYEFPVSKPKRQSYEWYHPKGILKKNWLLKHQHVLPAVVVLYQDMDWNDMQWSEHQLRCAATVQSIKNSLQGQSTKLAIALLQRATQQQPGEEQLAGERVAALASACDLNPKLIFAFPYNEHLVGYTYRLEASFLELAQSYYTQMAKQIRMHRDQLTDVAHLALKIRHQFKLAVIAEIRQDHAAALKNYSQAYAQLDEIRVVDTNCLEVKTIAGFLNYKICRLMFRSTPRDSIVHFKTHVERFRGRTGFREIAFEHYAWLSLQYSAFAELFCDAIKLGLPALQTQHPGIYYHQAAELMGRRKELFGECVAAAAAAAADGTTASTVAGPDVNASYANQFYSEYFGVRTTKIGDAATERQLFALVQANERQFNHSTAIIALLGQAMAQFKLYRCLRFRKKLAVDMAEEYLKSGDFSKALTLYSLMLSDYRTDRWHGIFTQCLLRTLQAARLSASVVDFLTCSIEAMSPHIEIDAALRAAIMDNFWRVLQNAAPIPSADDVFVQPAALWDAALQKIQHQQPLQQPAAPIVVIDLDKISQIFECTLTFRQPQVKHDEPLNVDLFIRTRSPLSFKLSAVRAVLADSTLQFTLPARRCATIPTRRQLQAFGDNDTDDDAVWNPLSLAADVDDDILLQPNVCYKFVFTETDYKFPENEELRIVRLELTASLGNHRVLLTQTTSLNVVPPFRRNDPAGQSMDTVQVRRSCYVVPTFHLTAQTTGHSDGQPMLTNEYFRTEQMLSNTSSTATLRNVGLTITVPAGLQTSVFLCGGGGGAVAAIVEPSRTSMQRLQSQLHFDIGDMAPKANATVAFHVVALCEGNIDLRRKVWYQLPGTASDNSGQQQHHVTSTSLSLTVDASPVHRPKPTAAIGGPIAVPSDDSTTNAASTMAHSQQHNMQIERLANGAGVRKCREDVLIVPCVAEMALRARFYTLNKQPLRRAYCAEDVLLRVDVEVRAPCAVDVLDMFLIADHNVGENQQHKEHQRKQLQRKQQATATSGCRQGQQLRDVRMLRAHATSVNWQREPPPSSSRSAMAAVASPSDEVGIDWRRRGSAARLTATGEEFQTLMSSLPSSAVAPQLPQQQFADDTTSADKYKSNLLSKIPANSTIIGSTGAMSNNLMVRSVTELSLQTAATTTPTTTTTDARSSMMGAVAAALAGPNGGDGPLASAGATSHATNPSVRNVFNRALDAFVLTDHCRGFLRERALPAECTTAASGPVWPIWGVYCVRWRRSGDPNATENESKFVVQGIEVVDPPLNIYCHLEDRMFVKIPMTLTISIRNPTRYAMHLRTCLKNAEHFMFSGNTQLNVSIFARSTYELSFNLYPLKAGWQSLPEFEVKYNTQYDEKSTTSAETTSTTMTTATTIKPTAASMAVEVNQELYHLTQRWMPKKVFVLPMLKHCQT